MGHGAPCGLATAAPPAAAAAAAAVRGREMAGRCPPSEPASESAIVLFAMLPNPVGAQAVPKCMQIVKAFAPVCTKISASLRLRFVEHCIEHARASLGWLDSRLPHTRRS